MIRILLDFVKLEQKTTVSFVETIQAFLMPCSGKFLYTQKNSCFKFLPIFNFALVCHMKIYLYIQIYILCENFKNFSTLVYTMVVEPERL